MMEKELRDLEDIRNSAEDVRTFSHIHNHIESAEIEHEHCCCGHHHHEHAEGCGCGHDHSHEGHVHPHSHGDECSCGHEHHHDHHHVPGHPDDCQCEICHPHEEYCDVCGESLENCTCRMPDADCVKKVYILKNLGCANCAAKMEHRIKELPGVQYANISYVTKQLRLSAKDHAAVLPAIQEICTSIESGVEVVPREGEGPFKFATKVYVLENLGCAHCAAKMERAINNLPEVSDATLTFATKQLKVTAKADADLLPELQKICSGIESEVVVKERDGGPVLAAHERIFRNAFRCGNCHRRRAVYCCGMAGPGAGTISSVCAGYRLYPSGRAHCAGGG